MTSHHSEVQRKQGSLTFFSEMDNNSYYFSCLKCEGQLNVHLHSSAQTAMLEKMVLNVPEPVRIWICPVSVLPASPAAYAPLAQ